VSFLAPVLFQMSIAFSDKSATLFAALPFAREATRRPTAVRFGHGDRHATVLRYGDVRKKNDDITKKVILVANLVFKWWQNILVAEI